MFCTETIDVNQWQKCHGGIHMDLEPQTEYANLLTLYKSSMTNDDRQCEI